MILRRGNLFASGAEALVNPVNCAGVMGAGLALTFKTAFPGYYRDYRRACTLGELRPGRMHVYEPQAAQAPKLIISFPTKRHWRDPSRIEDIQDGLADLRRVLEERKPHSAAVPALGCGLGALDWEAVQPLMRDALNSLRDVCVYVYLPGQRPGTAPGS